jgi:ligand-binding sensor domain-containing protein
MQRIFPFVLMLGLTLTGNSVPRAQDLIQTDGASLSSAVDSSLMQGPASHHFRWELLDNQRLPAIEVFSMVTDEQGNKYLGTKGGLTWISRYDEFQKWTRASTSGGLPSDSINGLGIGENRELWVATERGLARLANNAWTVYTSENTRGGLPANAVTSVAVGRREVWVGTHQGFAQFRGGSWTTFSGEKIAGRLPHRGVTAIAMDSVGNRWIGTIAGLVKYSGASWTTHTRESTGGAMPHSSITYLTVAPNGTLWIGTQNGLCRYEHNRFVSVNDAATMGELANEQVYSISTEPSGILWAASKGGAGRFDGKNWLIFSRNTTTGIRTRWIYSVLATVDGEIWFGTQKGVSRRIPVPLHEIDP